MSSIADNETTVLIQAEDALNDNNSTLVDSVTSAPIESTEVGDESISSTGSSSLSNPIVIFSSGDSRGHLPATHYFPHHSVDSLSADRSPKDTLLHNSTTTMHQSHDSANGSNIVSSADSQPIEDMSPRIRSKMGWVTRCVINRIPVLFVLAILAGDLYVVFGFTRSILNARYGTLATAAMLTAFGICACILLVTYYRVVFTSSAVRKHPPPSDFLQQRAAFCPRCDKCNYWKPPRAHHCSMCDECILKMDHHCPWVGGCVGLYNYKFFLTFLFWVAFCAAFYGILTGAAMSADYQRFAETGGVFATLSLFLTLSFAISTGGFFGFHVQLLCSNKTTLENMRLRPGEPSPYQRGSRLANFEAVFGRNKLLWFLPVSSVEETGYEWIDGEYESSSRGLQSTGTLQSPPSNGVHSQVQFPLRRLSPKIGSTE